MTWGLVGERIEKLRRKHKLSQNQFGKMIGISGQYLGLVEKGTHGLSVGSIVNICDKTGVSADYLLFGAIDLLEDPITDILSDLSHEQINIALDIIKQVAQFVNTEDGNELLIRELLRRQHANAV